MLSMQTDHRSDPGSSPAPQRRLEGKGETEGRGEVGLREEEALDIKRRSEMTKDCVPEKYGMVICPRCGGRGFLIKSADRINVVLRRVCATCGGFGAIKKEEDVSCSPGN